MLTAVKLSAAIVAGGLALGAALGTFANPQMKQPASAWWQSPDQGDAAQVPADAVWPDVSDRVVSLPDGYRPDLDYSTAITSYWEPPADWHWYGDGEDAGDEVAEEMPETSLAQADAAEQTADDAVQVADAAMDAQAAKPLEPAAGPAAPLESAGLY